MPEGDTIWRAARALHAALAGRTVTGFDSRRVALVAAAGRLGLVGRAVERVEPRGKHLLVFFDGGSTLHTHLGLHGRWRLERGRSARAGSACVVIVAGEVAAVCLRARVADLLSPRALARHPALARLGPDLLGPGFDAAEARGRLRAGSGRTLGEALLDQAALAGIGNVYKSEALFACGLSPLAPVAAVDEAALERLVSTARRLMLRNLGPGPRATTSARAPGTLCVYRRAGRPCRACGTLVRRVVHGAPPRSSYFCPRCQPAP